MIDELWEDCRGAKPIEGLKNMRAIIVRDLL